MSLDKLEYQRSIYSLLDFLGDVGGLNSILLEIGVSLGFFLASVLDNFLASKIFEARFTAFKTRVTDVQPFCQRDKKRNALISKAKQSIEKELDVVNFIRK